MRHACYNRLTAALAAMSFYAGACLTTATTAHAAERPNVLIILADDK